MVLLNSEKPLELKSKPAKKSVTHASLSSQMANKKKNCSTNSYFSLWPTFLYFNCIAWNLSSQQTPSFSPSSSSHCYQTPYPFMASKLLRNRIKPKDHHHQRTDVLALEKAAAWAWYQHGSGSEGKSMREFHLGRTQRDHRPSRYKLEAMRMSSSSSSQETKEEGLSSLFQHTNKKLPLLDAYEVRSILTRLDSLIAESDDDSKLDDNGGEGMMKKKKKKVGKGIWERRRGRVICSTRKEDVVDGTISESKKSQIQLSAPNKRSMPRFNGGRVM